jgi:outer membrane lipoprotein-sorting protein
MGDTWRWPAAAGVAFLISLTLAPSTWGQEALAVPTGSPEAAPTRVLPEVAEPPSAETAVSVSPEAGPQSDPRALDLLEQMAAAHQNLETLRGDFVQHRHSEMFLEDTVNTGDFACRRPDQFRYNYNASDATGSSEYFLRGDTAWAYIPELKQVEVYHLDTQEGAGRGFSRILIGLDGAISELRSTHWIHLAPPSPEDQELGESIAHLHLQPKEEVDPDGFTSIDLWVNTRSLLPEQLKMVDENGDITTLRLTNLTLNPEVDDSEFDPEQNIPPGTEFIEQ